MKTFKIVHLAIICLIFTACSSPEPKLESKQEAKLVVPKGSSESKLNSKTADANELLAFAEQYANSPLDAQKASLNNTNQALSTSPNDVTLRMRLAMIYALPSSNLQDNQKAQSLLQSLLVENNLNHAQLALAHILFDYVVANNKTIKNSRDEEKRLDAVLQKNENLLNKLELTQQKLDAMQQKLDTAQQKLMAAQQKIDELKNIEKSMGQRDTKK